MKNRHALATVPAIGVAETLAGNFCWVTPRGDFSSLCAAPGDIVGRACAASQRHLTLLSAALVSRWSTKNGISRWALKLHFEESMDGVGVDCGQRLRLFAGAAGAALVLAFLFLLELASDRATPARGRIDLPPLVLWAWDRDEDLRFLDVGDTGVAFLAATLTLRGDGVALTPRHNPLTLPVGVSRVAVVHVETDRAEPPVLSGEELSRFVEALASVGDEVPHRVLQVDYEAVASQRAFFIDAVAALRRRLPDTAISVTALASWCLNENWTGRLAADEVVPMLFRMGYDGRRALGHFTRGGDFRSAECRTSVGVATDELPSALPPGRRIYVFSPRRWTAETYRMVRTRMRQWSHDRLFD